MTLWLFVLQRASALVLAPLVLIHAGLVIYAIGDGLTAGDILSRTRGSWAWGLFYGLFVVAVAIHAPIGLRNVLREATSWRGLDAAMMALAIILLLVGARAVVAVVAP